MLQNAYCTIDQCDNELKTFREVATGICELHRNLALSNKHYVGVCWNCCRITGIYEIPRHLIGILNEKYIFSRGCSNCSPEPDADINWITIKKHTGNYWAIDEDGKLLLELSEKIQLKE